MNLFTNIKICSQLKTQGLKGKKKHSTESTANVRCFDFFYDLVLVAPLEFVLG